MAGARKLICFWGTKRKKECSSMKIAPGIADYCLRGHEDLVAPQRNNRRPADRPVRNVGHGVRPVQVLQALGNFQAFLQPPARAVDFQDHQVGALLLGRIQLAVEIPFQPGTDLALKADDDSMVVLYRLLGETIGSSQQERANRNRGKKPQIVQGFAFQVS